MMMVVVLVEGSSRGSNSTYTHGQAWRCFSLILDLVLGCVFVDLDCAPIASLSARLEEYSIQQYFGYVQGCGGL